MRTNLLFGWKSLENWLNIFQISDTRDHLSWHLEIYELAGRWIVPWTLFLGEISPPDAPVYDVVCSSNGPKLDHNFPQKQKNYCEIWLNVTVKYCGLLAGWQQFRYKHWDTRSKGEEWIHLYFWRLAHWWCLLDFLFGFNQLQQQLCVSAAGCKKGFTPDFFLLMSRIDQQANHRLL